MSIAEKLTTIAENVNKVYEAGYAKAEKLNCLYYATSLYYAFQNATFPENTDIVIKLKKAPTNCISMFQKATNIKSIKLISEDNSNVISGDGMFREIPQLEVIDLTEFNRKFRSVNYFTLANKKLKSILGALDVSACTAFSNSFNVDAGALADIEFVPNTIKVTVSFQYCPNLSEVSIQSIIDGLADLTGGTSQILYLHSTTINKLTDEQYLQISAKNWSVS